VDVRAEDLQSIMDAGKHLTRSPQASLLQLMKSMYTWAINHDVCTTNYADRVILQYTDDVVREHKPFTDEEIRQLIEADAALPLLLIFTGMRIGEVLELTPDRIHDGYIIGGLKTAAGRDRFIPVAGPILKYIRAEGQRYYFDTAGGRAWSSANYIAQRWKPLMESLGMDHHPHDARHTCATLMERAEIPLLHRKLILGHAVDDITEGRYTHVSREALAADMEKVAALFFS
jgi:integrase